HRAGRGRHAARPGCQSSELRARRRRRPDDYGDGLHHSLSRCAPAVAATAARDRTATGGGVDMAWNPNVPTVTNRVQDDLNAIRENFQHLDPLAPLAPYAQVLLDSRIVDHNLDVP